MGGPAGAVDGFGERLGQPLGQQAPARRLVVGAAVVRAPAARLVEEIDTEVDVGLEAVRLGRLRGRVRVGPRGDDRALFLEGAR